MLSLKIAAATAGLLVFAPALAAGTRPLPGPRSPVAASPGVLASHFGLATPDGFRHTPAILLGNGLIVDRMTAQDAPDARARRLAKLASLGRLPTAAPSR